MQGAACSFHAVGVAECGDGGGRAPSARRRWTRSLGGEDVDTQRAGRGSAAPRRGGPGQRGAKGGRPGQRRRPGGGRPVGQAGGRQRAAPGAAAGQRAPRRWRRGKARPAKTAHTGEETADKGMHYKAVDGQPLKTYGGHARNTRATGFLEYPTDLADGGGACGIVQGPHD
eukprot:jgi/Tetstr1/463056/TSEL_007993.t1